MSYMIMYFIPTMKHPYSKKVLSCSLFGAGLLTAFSASAQDRPNIIVFLVDDMGLMDTSVPFVVDANGQPQTQLLNSWYHTPNMERLAHQGIRFSTFYAQSVSSPSRTSIMTGQNAARHRTTNWINAETNNRNTYGPMEWNWDGLTHDNFIFPKVLHEAGYRTIHVGKAHFGRMNSEGEDPKNLGFDVNIAGSSIGHPGSYYGEEGYGWIKGNRTRAVPDLEAYHNTPTFLTDALTMEAEKEIEKAVKEGKPFYLNMAHYAVHDPFMTDARFLWRYENSGKSARAQAFATLIEGMDQSLGVIMDKLEALGIAENTFIIFLGDNGGDAPLGEAADHGSSAPLKGKKGSEYEGGVRVPFIAGWAHPNAANTFQQSYPVAQNTIQTQMGTVMDIYPTVLSIAGVDVPNGYILDGSDLKQLMTGQRDKKHRDDFLMHFPHDHRCSYFTTYRQGDWKLIYYYHPEDPQHPTCTLFNLTTSPFELQDLAQAHPHKVKSLFRKMVRRLELENALYPVDKDGNELRPFLPND